MMRIPRLASVMTMKNGAAAPWISFLSSKRMWVRMEAAKKSVMTPKAKLSCETSARKEQCVLNHLRK